MPGDDKDPTRLEVGKTFTKQTPLNRVAGRRQQRSIFHTEDKQDKQIDRATAAQTTTGRINPLTPSVAI